MIFKASHRLYLHRRKLLLSDCKCTTFLCIGNLFFPKKTFPKLPTLQKTYLPLSYFWAESLIIFINDATTNTVYIRYITTKYANNIFKSAWL